MAQHALITGPIQGRIPDGNGGFVDVTPDVLLFDNEDDVTAAADAIEIEHAIRGSHPIQQACAALEAGNAGEAKRLAYDLGIHDHKGTIDAHQKAHKALNKKAGL
jgi:hypothetical protein